MIVPNLTPSSSTWEANLTNAIKSVTPTNCELAIARNYQWLTMERLCQRYLGEYLPEYRATLKAELLSRDISTRGDALAALRVLEAEDDRDLARHLLQQVRLWVSAA
jgi:hypothetical protein